MATASIVRYADKRALATQDQLADEEPLEIRVRGRAISVTMRTPGHDEELAAGFLLSEGVIHQAADILNIQPCGRNEFGNLINVQLAAEVPVDFERLTRHVFAASSCGLCGKATLDALRSHFPPIESDLRVRGDVILALPDRMRKAQKTFDQTGGLHAAALFAPDATLTVLREDVGRHNAVDKVIGRCLLDRIDLTARILLVSGRTSFEIMQKALAARIPIIAAVSAPSSLAVDFAKENGQTLIGFLREGRMNLYAHADRIMLD